MGTGLAEMIPRYNNLALCHAVDRKMELEGHLHRSSMGFVIALIIYLIESFFYLDSWVPYPMVIMFYAGVMTVHNVVKLARQTWHMLRLPK